MKPFRREKVASRIHEIIGDVLIHGLNDPRIDPLTTITRVEVSADLLIARVYVSVPGGEAIERLSLVGLRHAGGHVRREVARNLDLRQCPEIRFEIDERAKKVRDIMRLLEENRRQNPQLFPEEDEDADVADAKVADEEEFDDDDFEGEDTEKDGH